MSATDTTGPDMPPRRRRADAQRNVDALLVAARTVFSESGVDAPGQEIADRAGVGIGTMYRHFPKRSDLVAAVLANEIDECAAAAPILATANAPLEALTAWVERYTELVATKRGVAEALHSADVGLQGLAPYVRTRLEPALAALLVDVEATLDTRLGLAANDVLVAIALLCQPVPDGDADVNRRLVATFMRGLLAPAPAATTRTP